MLPLSSLSPWSFTSSPLVIFTLVVSYKLLYQLSGILARRLIGKSRTLLERSLAPHDAFELKDVPRIGKKAKELRGFRRQKMVPLAFPEHAHHLENPGEGSGGQSGVAIGPGTPTKSPE